MTKLLKDFINSEKSGGLILVFCTIISLSIANSTYQNSYSDFWQLELGALSLEHWINDALMAVFFLLIGLELEREIYIGELSDVKNAILPISGAIGGMLIPALLFMIFNFGTATQSGAGIPMATDIAFSLGVLSLLGKRVPVSLKVFLIALAVVDDLGAILIIALFYTKTLIWTNLIISLSIFSLLILLNRIKVRNLIPYVIGGIGMWYFMLHSGIHSTITGILLAFAIPFGNGDKNSPSYIVQHFLHLPVAFVILPLFALANTAIIIHSDWAQTISQPYGLGILAGLILGKPLGIILFSSIAVALGLCVLPEDVKWKQLVATGFLAGIGFTMSIFITLLAFDDEMVINNAKFVILVASLIAGIIGFLSLKFTLKQKVLDHNKENH